MSKWKKMGKDYSKGIMICPNCNAKFINRYKRCCPDCRIKLVYPGEGFNYPPTEEGYIWLDKWVKFSEVDIK